MTERIGLVLGAGGVVGGAFHAGLIAALAEGIGWDARSADLVVGTSAGSMTGAMLRAGLAPRDLAARAFGEPLSPEGQKLLAGVGPPPAPPEFRLDFRNLVFPAEGRAALASALLRPWSVSPSALSATAMPEGQNSTEPMQKLLEPIFGHEWPHAPLWLVAVRLRDAQRVVFGRDEVPNAHVAVAVASSCAIPGVYEPVTIDGARYVDGGAHSPTNADLLRGEPLDLVLVSSPMSIAGRQWSRRLDEPVRRLLGARLAQEISGMRRAGVEVVSFQPGPEDLAAMGMNPMDPSRRGSVARQARESVLRRLKEPKLRDRLAALG